jgi:predicted alpha/beta hydrolase family esterase
MPGAFRVVQNDWSLCDAASWDARLEEVVSSLAQPAVLIAHSAGAVTVARWASRPGASVQRVAGAFLVAPPDFDARLPEGFPDPVGVQALGWSPMPGSALPFPAQVVASRTDPFDRLLRTKMHAETWGAEYLDAGELGHINLASGQGHWDQGWGWFEEFLGRITRG